MAALFYLIWPDLLVLTAGAFYLRAAWKRGFFASFLQLAGFAAALAVATVAYLPLATRISALTGLSRGYAKTLGFIAVWWAIVTFATPLIRHAIFHIPKDAKTSVFNRAGGLPAGLLEFFITVPFVLSLLTSLPLPAAVKTDISQAPMSGLLLRQAESVERLAALLFGDAFQETLSFVAVGQREESQDLGFRTVAFTSDQAGERQLFDLVNAERAKNGLPAYVWDDKLAELGRLHSADMLVRGYFSHDTPEGRTTLQRAAAFPDLHYRAVGENIAFTVDVPRANAGLLASPGHRANILSSVFTRIGIGIESVLGKGIMVSQEFAD